MADDTRRSTLSGDFTGDKTTLDSTASTSDSLACLASTNGSPAAELASFAQTIEREIIPRLFVSHAMKTNGHRVSRPRQTSIGAHETEQFTAMILQGDTANARDFVEDLRRRGMCDAQIYLELLAPTARRLGDLWSKRECGTDEVTSSLHQLRHFIRGV